jgi:hypothetical protein
MMRYFKLELQEGIGSGGRGIITNSFFRSLGNSQTKMEDGDIKICLQFAVLCNPLSSRQNTLMAGFLNLFLSKSDKISSHRND